MSNALGTAPEPEFPACKSSQPARVPPSAGRTNLLRDLRWALSLFLVGLGAKFFLIFRFGTPLPFWDAWDGEARGVFLRYFHGNLTLSHLFEPHVEHRIFFTRIYDLILLLLNGQWDGRLEMAGNAVMHCAAIAGLGWLMVHLMGRNIWPLIWLPFALMLAVPFAWENTLGGFYSQFYFLLIFSILTISLLGLSPPLTVRWWLGVASGTTALFTAGSGMLAAAAVFAVASLDILKEKRILRAHLPLLAACILVGIAGILLKPHIPETEALKAHSMRDFLVALGRNLAWPRTRHGVYFILNLVPIFWLAAVYLKSHWRDLSAEKMVLGMAAWVILQAIAAAYARGSGGSAPASRYMDSSSFIMIVDGLALTCLLPRHLSFSRFYKLALALALIWGANCLVGLWKLDRRVWNEDIPERCYYQGVWLKSARAFLATDDPRVLDRKQPLERIYPGTRGIVTVLRNPEIRRILPACVREPLPVVQANHDDATFHPISVSTVRWDTPSGPGWSSHPATNLVGGKFESLPLGPSSLPYLEFPVAGDFSEPGISLNLLDLGAGRLIPIRLPSTKSREWQTVHVRAPAAKFEILAANTSKTATFAFKEPRELGSLSFWSMRLLGAWNLFLVAGLACLLLNLALLVRAKHRGTYAASTLEDRMSPALAGGA